MRLILASTLIAGTFATGAFAGQFAYTAPHLTWPDSQTTDVPTRLCTPGTNVGDTNTDCAPAE